MRDCGRSLRFFKNSKQRHERMLRKMAAMRAAKERKRLQNPSDREPDLLKYFPFEFGIREKSTGETAFRDFVSVRDSTRRLSALRRYLLNVA